MTVARIDPSMSTPTKRDAIANAIAEGLYGPPTFDLWSPEYQAEILEAADEVLDEAGRSAGLADPEFHGAISKAVARGLDDTGDNEPWTPEYRREMSAVADKLVPVLRGFNV